MELLFALFSFLSGAVVGSFLNVVAWRVPRGESIIRPGSHCLKCGAPVKWYDNVPVLSWFVLKGRCRSCREKFTFRYALVELAAGLLFAGIALNFGIGFTAFRYFLFVSLLICAVLTDLDHWIILDSVSIGGAAAGVLLAVADPAISALGSMAAAAGAFCLFLLIRFLSIQILRRKPGYTKAPKGYEDEEEDFQGGMGWGDIKLAGMTGAFLGPSLTGVALFAGFLIGAVVGTAVILHGRDRRVPIPFGPFLAAGAVFSVFLGEKIWMLYITAGLNG
ncbi:MAG: prepilin peptidase [Candidatus Aegiribacteria sp.]|nr:prepilin peptidase [Candidatus Aegiribacteria sp.]MBD3294935.1 prepilin peptidase [Candidatus Fermentibacteria bacterium]